MMYRPFVFALTLFTVGCESGPEASGATEPDQPTTTADNETDDDGSSAETAGEAADEAAAEPTDGSEPTITPEGAPILAPVTTPRTEQTGDVDARCARLATLALEDLDRMLTFLGGTPEQSSVIQASMRPEYERTIGERCARVDASVLTCVETADHVLSGMARCGMHASSLPGGNAAIARLPILTYDGFWQRYGGEVTDPDGAAALRDALIGRWVRQESPTWSWTFTDDGTGRFTDGVQTVEFPFVTTSESRLYSPGSDEHPGSEGSTYSAVTDGRILHFTPLSNDGAQPIVDGAPMIMSGSGIWRIWDVRGTPRCTGFTLRGQPMEAVRCAWVDSADQRRLQIRATSGHDLATGEPAVEGGPDFIILADHLVRENATLLYERSGDPGPSAP